MVQDCPKCGMANPPEAVRCDCGYDFATQRMERSYLSTKEVESTEPPRRVLIESKLGQRLGGLFFLILGSGFTVWSWYTALNEGYYYRKAVAVFPGIAVIGLGMLFYPIDMEQFRATYGVDRPNQFAHYPIEWKVLFFVALAAGLGNWFVISQWQNIYRGVVVLMRL